MQIVILELVCDGYVPLEVLQRKPVQQVIWISHIIKKCYSTIGSEIAGIINYGSMHEGTNS